jgi:GTP-binding protein Era
MLTQYKGKRTGFRTGFTAIVGRPNVGKSTLLNSIIGEKVAITTAKAQTTRNNIRGIYNEPGVQIVFLDTPGIHKPQSKLGEAMVAGAISSIQDVDVVVFLVEEAYKQKGGNYFIVNSLQKTTIPKILVINKTDKLSPEEYKKIYDSYESLDMFDHIFPTIATDATTLLPLVNTLKTYTSNGPAFYDEDMYTDKSERFLISELIREKLLMFLEDEIPHGVAVEIEGFEEKRNLVKISAIIYIEKKSHKGIIIGKGGAKLKGIGKAARADIEKLLEKKVFLETFVKIKPKWRDDASLLNQLGFFERD